MTKPDGGPAFPRIGERELQGGCKETVNWEGMSLRDYFAAKAMQALIPMPGIYQETDKTNGQILAEIACGYADALLAELKKGEG